MLSVIGLLIVLVVVGLLLTNRVSPIVALVIVPVIGAVIAGFNPAEIADFFNSGLNKVLATATMFIFAILYFGVMKTAGLFDPLIYRVIKLCNGNVIAIAVGTVLIGAIAHLDGSGASTFLITIPALLPIYQQLRMSPYLLVLLVGASASIMNMVPWGGPLGRAATVIGADPSELWYSLIPLQIVALMLLAVMAVILGVRERRRIAMVNINHMDTDNSGFKKSNVISNFNRNNRVLYWFNVLLTILLVAVLVMRIFPTSLTFMLALSIALPVNFPSVKQQMEQIKLHAPSALMMSSIILAAGVFLGILNGSGMLSSLAVSLVGVLSSEIVPYLHLIVAFFGAPFELLLNTDAYYFALLPLVEQTVSQFGVEPTSTAYAMLIGNVIGTFISPFSPALWLAMGLAGIEMGRYIRYAIWWIWGLSIILLCIAKIMGIF
ncbi:MAG: citrate:proton symporter [Gammaproteobacteria bacterium]|nr:citrate:proton symporter [Gammaproteobacteria bacterium]